MLLALDIRHDFLSHRIKNPRLGSQLAANFKFFYKVKVWLLSGILSDLSSMLDWVGDDCSKLSKKIARFLLEERFKALVSSAFSGEAQEMGINFVMVTDKVICSSVSLASALVISIETRFSSWVEGLKILIGRLSMLDRLLQLPRMFFEALKIVLTHFL